MIKISASAFLLTTLLALPAQAEDGSLRVTATQVTSESDTPEICLSFNQPINVARREQILNALRLEHDDEKQDITSHDLSLTGNELCVQNLEHGGDYKLTLSAMHGTNGQKLDSVYTHSFSIKDRKPSLNFLSTGPSPIVRTMNIHELHLRLFAITDRAQLANAWRQYAQVRRVPSESLYFAAHNGEEIWQSDLALHNKPNTPEIADFPLPALKPGLYFLAAAPRGSNSENNTLMAGTWLTAAPDKAQPDDLRLSGMMQNNELKIFAQTRAVPANPPPPGVTDYQGESARPRANIALQLLDKDNKEIASTRSDNEGQARFTLDPDARQRADLVIATTDQGEVAFYPLSTLNAAAHPNAAREQKKSAEHITLTADRALLGSDGEANISLKLNGANNALRSGTLQWQAAQPDFSAWDDYDFGTLAEEQVSEKNSTAFITDADGTAHFPPLKFGVNSKGAVLISASLDGTKDSGHLLLPYQPTRAFVGIRQLESKNNGDIVQFDIIALDAEQHRRSMNDMYFQIYEEGRSFDWYQSEGRWSYRPLPQHHRIGGGAITIASKGENPVRWPVQAGATIVEITDAEGTIYAQRRFYATENSAYDEALNGVPTQTASAEAAKSEDKPTATNNMAATPIIALPAPVSAQIINAHKIAAKQSATLAAPKKQKIAAPLWISPAPLEDAPLRLQSLLSREPFGTLDLAQWLDLTREWQGLIAGNLMNGAALETLQKARLEHLLSRQREDGGFAALPGDGAPDLIATAAAAVTMAHYNVSDAIAAPTINWLQHRLENTWFDERDRPQRAAGFLALAQTGHSDIAGLRYFGETSRDKALPARAAAQLALAFALSHDDGAAQVWLQKTRDARAADSDNAWNVTHLLAVNMLSDANEVLPQNADVKNAPDAALLHTLYALANRAGLWRVNIGGSETKHEGISLLPFGANVRNNNDNQSLYVAQITPASTPRDKIFRSFVHLDGSAVAPGEPLHRGSYYMMMLSGNSGGIGPDSVNILQIAREAALRPVATPHWQMNAMVQQWHWLAETTPWQAIDVSPSAISVAFTAPRGWRIAVPVQAEKNGSLTRIAPALLSQSQTEEK